MQNLAGGGGLRGANKVYYGRRANGEWVMTLVSGILFNGRWDFLIPKLKRLIHLISILLRLQQRTKIYIQVQLSSVTFNLNNFEVNEFFSGKKVA